MFTPTEAEAILTVALLTATADGRSDAPEREQIRSLFESLAADADLPSLADLHRRSALRQLRLADALDALTTPEAKRAAFETAVCVAEAAGSVQPAEQAFLDELERRLGLTHEEAVAFEREAHAIALAEPDSADERLDPAELLGPQAGTPVPVEAAPAPAAADPRRAEIDRLILRYSILNGALELLPQNLATMAILPLQTKMVYAIGKRHGHTLGPGHIKEFIATLGLGATSQMLENMARKVLGKLAKKTLGKTAGTIVKKATGPMMTFASTYAIGRVAESYYASGRTLSVDQLRSLFQSDLARGRALYEQHRPQIEQNAQTLRPQAVLDMMRGTRAV
jgi:uncharacterized protein (DUF697 family)/tellurite resistance protein